MRKLFIPFTLLLFMASCKKSDSGCSISATSIQGTYKVTGATYKASSSDPVEDEFATWDACEKDDHITLASSGVLTMTDAGIVCSPSGDDTGTWSLSGNTLTVAGIISYDVTNFSCSGMVITYKDDTTGETEVLTLARV